MRLIVHMCPIGWRTQLLLGKSKQFLQFPFWNLLLYSWFVIVLVVMRITNQKPNKKRKLNQSYRLRKNWKWPKLRLFRLKKGSCFQSLFFHVNADNLFLEFSAINSMSSVLSGGMSYAQESSYIPSRLKSVLPGKQPTPTEVKTVAPEPLKIEVTIPKEAKTEQTEPKP